MSRLWRTHTTIILVFGVLLIIGAAAASYIVTHYVPRVDVRIATATFKVRLADSEAERKQGLSGVASLLPMDGMLFVFETDETWGIWMKDMKVPIDILWIDKTKRVVHIVTNASPELGTSQTFEPTEPARYVLEIPAGSVKQYNIKVGDRASFVAQENL